MFKYERRRCNIIKRVESPIKREGLMEFEVIYDVRTDKEKTKDFTDGMRYIMDLEKQRKQFENKEFKWNLK